MFGRRTKALCTRAAAVGAALTLAGLVPLDASAAAPTGCPEAMPLSEVVEGMSATGYTTARGTTPRPFDVEVLGVLRNPLVPVRHMIVVEASGPDIERYGGIWAGMSGSPVYVGDRLVGAVAYKLTFGSSRVAGLTPAADMLELLSRPGAAGPATAGATGPARIALPDRLRARIARATGVSTQAVGGSLVQLKLPLGVSGLGSGELRGLRHFMRTHNVAVVPFAGGSVDASQTADDSTLEPGGNFAAALSYGDLTYAAIGTTTLVCEGKAVAFGHPFFWEGETMMGANTADAITVVDDPVYGPYKLAEVGGSVGTVEQDRFAGIRATLDRSPRTIPVTSTITSSDTGGVVAGRTDVVFGQDVVHTSLDHLYVGILAAQDRVGEGSATMSWTIRGTRESGGAWELSRRNMYTSRWGIEYDALEEYHLQMHRIEENRFEPVEFTGVHADVTVREAIRQYAIAGVRASVGGSPYREVRLLRVRPGALISLEVRLAPFEGTADMIVRLRVRAPWKMKGAGTIEVTGGRVCPLRCGRSAAESFDDFLRAEAGGAHNNDLLALVRREGAGRAALVGRARHTVDRVVTGQRVLRLFLRR